MHSVVYGLRNMYIQYSYEKRKTRGKTLKILKKKKIHETKNTGFLKKEEKKRKRKKIKKKLQKLGVRSN